mgnify:CR=1 FL=1
MKKLLFVFCLLIMTMSAIAQGKYYSKNAAVDFSASTPLEDIEAKSNSGVFILDTKTGRIESSVLVKSFQFARALMQEHFNENYLESTKYPKATFKGEITNLSEVNFKKDGTYKVKVKGTMDMHGVQKEMTTEGTVTVANGKISKASSDFIIKVADYDIKIPSVVADKIAKEVKVTVNSELQPLGK